jgi:hypothetical protein
MVDLVPAHPLRQGVRPPRLDLADVTTCAVCEFSLIWWHWAKQSILTVLHDVQRGRADKIPKRGLVSCGRRHTAKGGRKEGRARQTRRARWLGTGRRVLTKFLKWEAMTAIS